MSVIEHGPWGVSWTCEEPMERSSHALADGERVWLVDPVADDEGLDAARRRSMPRSSEVRTATRPTVPAVRHIASSGYVIPMATSLSSPPTTASLRGRTHGSRPSRPRRSVPLRTRSGRPRGHTAIAGPSARGVAIRAPGSDPPSAQWRPQTSACAAAAAGTPTGMQIISRILSTIMTLVTAPFRALAALFGGRGRRT